MSKERLMEPEFKPVADHALMVGFADKISDVAHAKVIALDKALATEMPAGMSSTNQLPMSVWFPSNTGRG